MIEPYVLEPEVIPGILEKEWGEIEKKLTLIKGFAKVIQIDLVDGKFAPNTTWMDASAFAPYTKDALFEVQMIVEDPLQYLEDFAKAGFRRFIGHIEKMPDVAAFVAAAEQLGEVGLAIDSPTSVETLFPYIEDIDVAFIMTVKAGYSRQKFLPDMLEKVKILHEKAPFLPIEVDGGMTEKTIVEAKNAGATRFVTTGFIFDSQDPKSQYEFLASKVA